MARHLDTSLGRALLSYTPNAVVAVNPDQKIQFFNPSAETVFGYHAEEVQDQPLDWLIPEASRTAHRRWVADFARDDGEPRTMGERGALLGRRADGTRFPAEITVFTLAEAGRTLLVALVHDLTDLRDVEAHYRKETDLLARALNQSGDMAWVTDPEGTIEYTNRALAEALGWSREEIIGTRFYDLWRSGHHDRAFYQRLWRTLRAGEPFREVSTNCNRAGEVIYWDETITPISDDSGEVTHYVATARDVTERFEREQRLHQLAYFDLVTGLANRRHFEDRLAEALARAERAEQWVGVLLLDLNRFKEVNDHLGHLVGDEMLEWVGARLAGVLRGGDLAARFGGDEFAVVLEPVAGLAGCVAAAEKVGNALNRTAQLRGHSIPVSASIGVALFPQTGEDPQTLTSRADMALYEAKASGEHYRVFSAAEARSPHFEIQLALEHALEEADGIAVRYQPILGLREFGGRGGAVVVEALARCALAGRGEVSPAEFIPVAEESGLIHRLGERILRLALADLRRWRDAGAAPARVAVNLSPVQLRDPKLPDRIEAALAEAGVAGESLELELTEEAMVRSDAADWLGRLADLGIRLTLDDFGTGYSSPNYLRELPLHGLKIDQGFVRGIETDSANQTILQALLVLATGFDLAVTLEGIETAAEEAYLREALAQNRARMPRGKPLSGGCLVQGFLYSEPLSADDCRAFF